MSFGIYLDQTIGLTLLSYLLKFTHFPDWAYVALIPVGYALVLGMSFGIAWFCYKVAPFGILIGRPQIHLFKKKGDKAHDQINHASVQSTKE